MRVYVSVWESGLIACVNCAERLFSIAVFLGMIMKYSTANGLAVVRAASPKRLLLAYMGTVNIPVDISG